jgi:hypothetical protein
MVGFIHWRSILASILVVFALAVVVGGLLISIRVLGDRAEETVVSVTPSANSLSAPVSSVAPTATLIISPTSTNPATPNQSQTAEEIKTTRSACLSVDRLLETFEQKTPTWNELECHFAELTRSALPAFSTHISLDYDAHGDVRENLTLRYRNFWQQYENDYSSNVSSTSTVGMPPYVGADGQVITYPLSSANFDLKMRGAAVAFIAAKESGKRVIFQTFHPPSNLAPKFATAEEFRAWTRDFWLPQKKTEADLAEKLKAEYYVPFPVEADVFFNPIDQPELDQLPKSELVSLAQEWIDQTHATVRPLYQGRLLIQLAGNYASWPHWLEINATGFDELAATVLPGCDVSTTETYLTTQFSGYRAIAARAGIPWSIGELGFYEKYYKACDHSKAEFEKELYETAFRLLDASDPKPVGLSIDETSPTSEAKETIRAYFAAHGG